MMVAPTKTVDYQVGLFVPESESEEKLIVDNNYIKMIAPFPGLDYIPPNYMQEIETAIPQKQED